MVAGDAVAPPLPMRALRRSCPDPRSVRRSVEAVRSLAVTGGSCCRARISMSIRCAQCEPPTTSYFTNWNVDKASGIGINAELSAGSRLSVSVPEAILEYVTPSLPT